MIRTYLEHLTMDELTARLAQIENQGKETADRIARGERGNGYGSPYIHKGSWRHASQLEVSLNWQRGAWKQTKLEISRRNQI